MISLTLPEPPSANRYWRVWRGRAVKSTEARAYQLHVKYLAIQQRVKAPIAGDVVLTVVWYRSRRAGDLDNRLKCLLDALKGVTFGDDKQVKEIHAKRVDDAVEKGTMRVTVVRCDDEVGASATQIDTYEETW